MRLYLQPGIFLAETKSSLIIFISSRDVVGGAER